MSNDTKHPAWHGDEFHGQGGSFIFDPKTGKRTRVPPEKADAGPAPAEAKPAAAAGSAKSTRKE